MRPGPVRFAVAAALYGLLTVALTWPLLLHPASLVPSDLGDSLLNTWIMSWNAHVMPLTERWWNAPQFFPVTGALGFSEHLLGLAPITTPIIRATGDPLLAYNVTFLLAFPLTALATHYLAFTITKRHDLSAVAAIAFAFAPYRMAQMAHVQVIATWWMPLAFAGLHRYFEDRRARWLALFAGGWLMQALTCGYYLFYLSILIVLWLAWFALFRGRTRELARVLAAWAAAALLLAPVLYGYWRITRTYNLHRGILEIRAFSADLASVLTAPDMNRAWHWLRVAARPEGDLFPGATVLALIAVGAGILWPAAARSAGGNPRAARLIAGIGLLPLAIAIARLTHGPFKIAAAGVRLMTVTGAEKPVGSALACFIAAGLLHPAIRTAWQRRSAFAFYILGAIAMWTLSLGPAPTLVNQRAFAWGPYAALLTLPGMDGVRVPARFWMLAALSLALAAMLAVRTIVQRWPRTARWLPAIACAALLLDGWPYPVPMAARPAERPNHAAAVARLDLPLALDHDILSVYRSAYHRRPVLNGYSGYFAPHYAALERLLSERDPGVLPRLAQFGSIEVTVDHALDPDGRWREFVAQTPGVRRVYEEDAYSSYLLPQLPSSSAPPGEPIPFAAATASVNPRSWAAVVDGDLETRWHVQREQRRGDSFTADLGGERSVSGVEMSIGRYVGDFPLELRVDTSTDGLSWSPAWSGRTGLLVFDAFLRDPYGVPLRVAMAPRAARFVRLTQTGLEMVHDWSIAELRILGSP